MGTSSTRRFLARLASESFGKRGRLFAVTLGGQAVGGNSLADQVVLDRVGASVRKTHVVFRSAGIVGMPLDFNPDLRVFLQDLDIAFQNLFGIGTYDRFVEVEVDTAQIQEIFGWGKGIGAGLATGLAGAFSRKAFSTKAAMASAEANSSALVAMPQALVAAMSLISLRPLSVLPTKTVYRQARSPNCSLRALAASRAEVEGGILFAVTENE
jgi:hypothetical protein